MVDLQELLDSGEVLLVELIVMSYFNLVLHLPPEYLQKTDVTSIGNSLVGVELPEVY